MQIVVVSQFTSFLSVLEPLVAEAGFSATRLDGTMPQAERADVVKVFQKTGSNTPSVLLLRCG